MKSADVVVDSEGKQWELEGPVREDLSVGTPKKLVSQFTNGFPKTWARGASQARKQVQLKHDLKEVNWLDLPFVGIEFRSIEEVRREPFSFPHLVRELQSGALADKPYPIYLFQCAQPCWDDATRSMKQVPYIVAIDCAVPPPSKLAYHSVQLAAHDVIDMKQLPAYARYEWTPYVPKGLTAELDKLPIQCYVLGWAGRQSQFSQLEEAAVHYIEYLHPYIVLPQVVEATPAPVVTSVDFEWEHGGKKYQIVFDKEIDRLATFIPEFLEDNELVGVVEDEVIKTALQAAFKEKRAKEEAKHQAVLDTVTTFSAEQQQQLRDIKTYKFYPLHPTLDTRPFADDSINQYFGKATHVVLPSQEDLATTSVGRAAEDHELPAETKDAAVVKGKRAREEDGDGGDNPDAPVQPWGAPNPAAVAAAEQQEAEVAPKMQKLDPQQETNQ